jgi:outer membrane protein TolC
MKKYALLLSLSTFILSNCTVGPHYSRPHTPIPKTFHSIKKTEETKVKFGEAQYFHIGQDISAQWWQLFGSEALNQLILTAFKHNPDIGAAKAALKNALEQAYAQRGEFVPYLGMSWAPSMQQTSGVLQSYLANNNYVYSLYTGQLFINYDLNAFGQLTREQEALMGTVEKSHYELEAAYLSLSSNIVNAVIQAASYRAQYTYIKRLIVAQNNIVNIFRKRYQYGDIPKTDLLLQESQLAQTKSQLPILKKQVQLQLHRDDR